MTLRACGFDQAKTVFQMHGVNLLRKPSLRKQMWRAGVLMYFVKLKPCLISMEAYGGAAPYQARTLREMGHAVKSMVS